MNKLYLSIVTSLLLVANLKAAETTVTLTANTPVNLFTSGKAIHNITAFATSANITTLKFFDSSSTSTTMVQAAYSSISSYNTNFVQVFTNESNVVITNTFSGIWTYPTAVTVATNTLPTLKTVLIPASSDVNQNVALQTIRGLTVVPNQNAIISITYSNP